MVFKMGFEQEKQHALEQLLEISKSKGYININDIFGCVDALGLPIDGKRQIIGHIVQE